jgi:glutathione S-transferase
MMILRSSPASPYGRKVRIAAAVLGLSQDIRLEAADTNDPADSLRGQNPLGKIPALILASGQVIFDSRVILEALDLRAGGGKIIPSDPERRIARLTLQALADGLADAALLQVYERRMRPPELHSDRWLDHQKGKVERALTTLEAGNFDLKPVDVGSIALSCALGYLDLRFAGAWRAGHPRLVAWLEDFAARVPAYEATRAAG